MKTVCLIRWDMGMLGGAEKMTAAIANELKCSYRVIVVSVFLKENKWVYSLDRSLVTYTLCNNDKRLRNNFFDVMKKMYYIIKKEKICTALVIDTTVFFLIPLLKMLGVKTIACEHSNLKNKDRTVGKYYWLRWIATKFSNKIITLTKGDSEEYINIFKLDNYKVDYIYNFVDIKCQNDKYNTQSKKIISVGRFDRIKGYDLLVEVAEGVFSRHKDWIWEIYGDGDAIYFNEIRNKIKEKKIDKNVILKGHTANMKAVYESASMLVLTSYNEGLPMVLLEAKLYKLPIVAFNCPTGPAEIVEENISGFLISCYCVKKMISKIDSLITNEKTRVKFSNNAMNNVKKFSKKDIMNKWISVIEN